MPRVVLGKVTYATTNVTTSWVKVLSANSRRKFAVITNASDTNMWLKLVAPGATPTGGAGTGNFLAANGFSYVIDNDNMWLGDVYCIHAGAGNKVAATEDGE